MTQQHQDSVVRRHGAIASFILNRPKALNALTHEQVLDLTKALQEWEADPDVVAVVIEGEGEKAFCAGGDIRALYHHIIAGDKEVVGDFFREEYRLNRRIYTYSKPYISLLDGFVMGGGAGLAINGRYRVATERTVFAMPETAIGFYPDVGGTYFLSRLPGAVGTYLSLTGNRLRAADTYHTGLATHFVPSSELGALKEALAEQRDAQGVEATLAAFHRNPGPAPLQEKRALIDHSFDKETLPEILAALETATDPWAHEVLAVIRSRSPSAVVVAFDAAQRGRALSFDDCLRLEYRLSLQVAFGSDFVEGVRAVVIDKNSVPQWSPASIEAVPAATYALSTIVPENGELTF